MATRTIIFGLLTGALAILACSSDPAAPSSAADAGAAVDASSAVDGGGMTGDAGPSGPWTTTACGTCAVGECKSRRDACDGDPSCAEHARCVDACAASASGTPDEACVKACPRGQGAASTKLRAAYDTCVRSPGDRCPACTVVPPSSVDVLSQTCGSSTETNECFKCEDLNCCQTFQGCVDEPECKQKLQPCLVACNGDIACKAACYEAHPKGVPAWARRQTCLLARCAAPCNGGQPVDPCVVCTTVDKCRDATARCTAHHDCFLLSECVTACTVVDDVCLDKCKAKYSDEAAALFDASIACDFASCIDKCG